jgi:hypothetical protein
MKAQENKKRKPGRPKIAKSSIRGIRMAFYVNKEEKQTFLALKKALKHVQDAETIRYCITQVAVKNGLLPPTTE